MRAAQGYDDHTKTSHAVRSSLARAASFTAPDDVSQDAWDTVARFDLATVAGKEAVAKAADRIKGAFEVLVQGMPGTVKEALLRALGEVQGAPGELSRLVALAAALSQVAQLREAEAQRARRLPSSGRRWAPEDHHRHLRQRRAGAAPPPRKHREGERQHGRAAGPAGVQGGPGGSAQGPEPVAGPAGGSGLPRHGGAPADRQGRWSACAPPSSRSSTSPRGRWPRWGSPRRTRARDRPGRTRPSPSTADLDRGAGLSRTRGHGGEAARASAPCGSLSELGVSGDAELSALSAQAHSQGCCSAIGPAEKRPSRWPSRGPVRNWHPRADAGRCCQRWPRRRSRGRCGRIRWPARLAALARWCSAAGANAPARCRRSPGNYLPHLARAWIIVGIDAVAKRPRAL